MSGKKGMKMPAGRKRPELTVKTNPGDNSKFIGHSLALVKMPRVDMRDFDAVSHRMMDYFELCYEQDVKPSVAGMALAFGCDRVTLWKWANGVESAYIPEENRNIVKKGYQMLNLQMEDYMLNGKINPVAGIFLMKNNFGYKDQTEQVIKQDPMGHAGSPEDIAARYQTDTVIDLEPIDSGDSE